jgi:4-oxalmesaconate hydratase
MIIDCHGHYTTAPAELQKYRDSQIAGLKDPAHVPQKAQLSISDDQIRESLEGAQLKFQRQRGTDMTIFSPRASAMAHHIGNETTSKYWTQACNDLI